MAYNLLVALAVVLLAASAAEGRSLRAEDSSPSAVDQLGSAASAGAGGNSSADIKEKVAKFYFEVQDVAAGIVESKANQTDEESEKNYRDFKKELDNLEDLWRNGSAASLAQVPEQLGRVSDAADTYATYVQQLADAQQGDEKQSLEALVQKLHALGQSAQALKQSALAELQAKQEAAEQKAAEQKAAEQKAAEKEAEQKEAEQKAAEQKVAEQKAAEQKAAEQKSQEGNTNNSPKVKTVLDLLIAQRLEGLQRLEALQNALKNALQQPRKPQRERPGSFFRLFDFTPRSVSF